jgi:hypothetical protein
LTEGREGAREFERRQNRVESRKKTHRSLDSASSPSYIIFTLRIELYTLTVYTKSESDSNVSTFLLRENARLESSFCRDKICDTDITLNAELENSIHVRHYAAFITLKSSQNSSLERSIYHTASSHPE